MKKIKVAIMGCTGLVGREFARLLDDHPYFELSGLTASSRSAGKQFAAAVVDLPEAGVGAATRAQLIRATTVEAIMQSGAKVVFSALPATTAGPLEAGLRASGLCVFSNASPQRLEPLVPLLVPEVNPGHLELARRQLREYPGFIVTNPNCVVAGLTLALKPLLAFGLRGVTVTTFQAVSGGGRRGVAAWDILGNVVPHIAGEEEKITRETRKILGTLEEKQIRDHDLEIYPSCSRVAVKDGHLQSITVEFPAAVSADEIAEALSKFVAEPQRLALPSAPRHPIVVRSEADRPQPALDVQAGEPARARGMAVSVGRLRSQGKRSSFFLLVHNTVRGAAGGSVLNAELAVRQNLISGVRHA